MTYFSLNFPPTEKFAGFYIFLIINLTQNSGMSSAFFKKYIYYKDGAMGDFSHVFKRECEIIILTDRGANTKNHYNF